MLRRGVGSHGSDDGFTLIELVITVAILGIVVASMVGMIFAYLRLGNETSTRLNETTDQQFVSAFWQEDVSSLGRYDGSTLPALPSQPSMWTGAAPPGVPTGCTTAPAGTTLVIGFAWTDFQAAASDPFTTWSTGTSNSAIYVTEPAGTELQMFRIRCVGAASTSTIVARNLDPLAPPTPACTYATSPSDACTTTTATPTTVSIVLTVRDKSQAVHTSTGYTSTLTAETRQG